MRVRSARPTSRGCSTPSRAARRAPSAAANRPGSFRRGAIMYAIAFAAAVILAKAAQVAFAVPDWVMSDDDRDHAPRHSAVSRHGLRATRIPAGRGVDAANRGGTRRRADDAGDDRGSGQPVPLVAARDSDSWRSTLGSFALLVVVLMALRPLGLGPLKSLMASGQVARSRQDSRRRFHVDWIRHHARKRHCRGGSRGPRPVAGHFHHHAAGGGRRSAAHAARGEYTHRLGGGARQWRGARVRKRS